jgi:hypothetical protein
MYCANLAISLFTRFTRTGDEALLVEAIELEREAVQLLSKGHPNRFTSCVNLAASLASCFNVTGDEALLNEAIELQREALQPQPDGHPHRWRALLGLAETYTVPTFRGADRDVALTFAKEALASDADSVPALLSAAPAFLSSFNGSRIHGRVEEQVLPLYTAVIDLALLVAGFLLDHTTQLQYLADCRELGPCTYFIASSVGKTDLGLRLLERARGIVWAQLLHLRISDPLLVKVPPVLAQELDGLLHKLGTYRSLEPQPLVRDPKTSQPFLKDRDVQHTEHTRLQRLIREIRCRTWKTSCADQRSKRL